MPQVTFRSHEVSVDLAAGASLLDAVRIARVRLEAPCNGGGTCGKCKVRLDDETRRQVRLVETQTLSAEEVADGWALLCSTLIEGDITIDLAGASERGLRILEEGQRLDLPLEPWIGKRFKHEGYATEVYSGAELLGKDPGDTTAGLTASRSISAQPRLWRPSSISARARRSARPPRSIRKSCTPRTCSHA